MTSTDRTATLLLVLAAFFWGGAFVAGKIALRHLPPVTVAFWRFAIGSGVLSVLWLRHRVPGAPALGARNWAGLAAMGVVGIFAYNWFFFRGLAVVEPGAAALVVASNPALTALVSAALLRERISWFRAAGFALAALGALVVLSGGSLRSVLALRLGPGAGFLGMAVVAWVSYVVLGKVLLRNLPAWTATTFSFLLGLPLLCAAAALEAPLRSAFSAPLEAWVALGFMGIFSSALAFAWFAEGVQRFGAARASVFIYLVPAFALLLSALVVGERVTPPKLAGGVLIVLGVALTNLRRAPGVEGD